jgi:hypothetical protein
MKRFQPCFSYSKRFFCISLTDTSFLYTRGKDNRTAKMRTADKHRICTWQKFSCVYISVYITDLYTDGILGTSSRCLSIINHIMERLTLTATCISLNTGVIPVENSMENHFISLRCSNFPFSLISSPSFTFLSVLHSSPPSCIVHVQSKWRYRWTSEYQLRCRPR